ncbi:hypothetical protein LPJ63_004747 [Coemansia sp. RSA 2711]|nr:hypothetical protein LPJ63_004747 [Coemansia sp. RSA 2711]
MRASELPSDVLVSVFGKLADLPNCDIKTTAVFECQRKNGDPCVRFATPEDTPENTWFTTNLPLLLPYHECTKQLCIRMSTPIDIRYFISFVFGKLEAHGAWPNISLLRARSVAIRTLEDGSSRVVYRELVQMVPRIVRVLPNVSSLQMEAYADDAVVRSFGGRLAAVYAKQLQKFFPAVPMPLKKSCWFTQLTSLNIGFSVRNLQQTLRVSAEHLQNLCMRGIPDTYMWETFDLDQGPIVFRRLIRLALKRLKIQCGGNQIKVYRLDFSAPVRQYMACLYDEGSNDAGFVQMANYLLESIHSISLLIAT